ncbi:hypothetical protein niasHT_031072 [Heterodera trifolii]|uniref:Uncharacterized protein n=1 Tax=Heterodera trifolii TaxID=157864 RepID=A0ABD2HYN7_9BILA
MMYTEGGDEAGKEEQRGKARNVTMKHRGEGDKAVIKEMKHRTEESPQSLDVNIGTLLETNRDYVNPCQARLDIGTFRLRTVSTLSFMPH